MSEQYFPHHILLVNRITLLNKISISEKMIVHSKVVLVVRRFKIVYEKAGQTCTLHSLLHLPDEMKEFGPLWTVNYFGYKKIKRSGTHRYKTNFYGESTFVVGIYENIEVDSSPLDVINSLKIYPNTKRLLKDGIWGVLRQLSRARVETAQRVHWNLIICIR